MHYPVSSKLFVKSACSKRAALFKARHGASSIFAHALQASQLASNSASSQNHRK
jgi:aspartate/tyrosine/aromatic aminotransferase